jgi:phosphotransferase system HPr-like phosphotransfer protein
MKSGTITLHCHRGLHTRPATIIVKLARLFPNTDIFI